MKSLGKILLPLAVIVGLAGSANADGGFLGRVRDNVNGAGVRTTYVPSSNLSFPEYSLETSLDKDWYAGLSFNPIPFADDNFDYGAYGNIRNSVTSANLKLLGRVDDYWLLGGEVGVTREHLEGNGVNETRFPLNASVVSDYQISGPVYLTGRVGITGPGRWLREFNGNGYDGTLKNLTVSAGLNVRDF